MSGKEGRVFQEDDAKLKAVYDGLEMAIGDFDRALAGAWDCPNDAAFWKWIWQDWKSNDHDCIEYPDWRDDLPQTQAEARIMADCISNMAGKYQDKAPSACHNILTAASGFFSALGFPDALRRGAIDSPAAPAIDAPVAPSPPKKNNGNSVPPDKKNAQKSFMRRFHKTYEGDQSFQARFDAFRDAAKNPPDELEKHAWACRTVDMTGFKRLWNNESKRLNRLKKAHTSRR